MSLTRTPGGYVRRVFVPFDRQVRVHLGVVALGDPPRLASSLAALVAHESRHDFVVSCLVKPRLDP